MKKEFELLEHQAAFVESNARYVLNSGGVGSGKTYSLVLKCLKLIIQNPGIHILVGAQTLPLLRDTTLVEFINLVPPELIREYNKSTLTFHFHNGAKILFRPLDEPSKLKSLNLGAVLVEEFSDIKESIFDMLRTRLRQKNMPCIFAAATNPAGFNNFVYRHFIETPLQGSEIIYSKSSNNFFLPAEYLADLEQFKTSNPEYYKRMIDGIWGSLEGLIYNLPYESRVKREAIPAAFERVVAGLDFGYGHPTALSVIGQTGDKWYIVDEIYKRSMTSFDIVKAVKEKVERWKIKKIYCDWARPEIIKDLQNAGVPAVEAIKTVFDGILYVQGLVNQGRLIVCNDCTYTLREFDSYVWAKNQSDQPLKINDDALDAVRYCLFTDRQPEFNFRPITANNEFSRHVVNPFNPFDPKNRPATNTGISF